jgi:hypothetical protein
MMLVC